MDRVLLSGDLRYWQDRDEVKCNSDRRGVYLLPLPARGDLIARCSIQAHNSQDEEEQDEKARLGFAFLFLWSFFLC